MDQTTSPSETKRESTDSSRAILSPASAGSTSDRIPAPLKLEDFELLNAATRAAHQRSENTQAPARLGQPTKRPKSLLIESVEDLMAEYEDLGRKVDDDKVRAERARYERDVLSEHVALMAKHAKLPAFGKRSNLGDVSEIPEANRNHYLQTQMEIWDIIRRQPKQDQKGPIIILHGSGGEGKSTMICAIIRALVLGRAGVPTAATYRTRESIGDAFEETSTPSRLHESLVRYPMLAIDECDKAGRWPAPELARVQRIIRERHEAGTRTIVACNAAERSLADLFTSIVVSRAKVGGAIVQLSWPDLRGRLLSPAAADSEAA